VSPTQVFKPAQILARVGDQFIFYGDVAPTVEMMLDSAMVRAKSEAERQAIVRQRDQLLQPVLQQFIQNKMMYLAFDRDIRAKAKDKYSETRTKISKSVREAFDKQFRMLREKMATASPEEVMLFMRQSPVAARLALVMRDHQLESLGELELQLRSFGTSLDQQIVQFGESLMGRDMASQHFKQKHEVTHQEMLDYYQQHADDYRVLAKARFEILTVKWESFRDRNAARDTLANMGNRVYFGASFVEEARRGSQEPKAKEGGQYDWVSQGSLASKPIDQAIFALDPGLLSDIIEDDTGCHIVRVHERQPAGMVSFVEAQPKIKETIEQQKKEAEYKKFVALLQKSTVVWTIYDPPAPSAEQR
jgi:parvulin-like peptidyl-prolyl isomerase